jgi:hypothetical protein
MLSNKTNKFHAEKIHLIKIEILKCHIDSPFELSLEKIKGHKFKMDFDLGFNLEDQLIKADFKLNIVSKSKGKNIEEATGDFHFAFIFNIENLNELAIVNKRDQITLDGNLGNAIASITYSTTRGILFTRLRGTSLEGFILPVINPNELLSIEKK